MKQRIFISIVCLAVLSTPAFADIYKCKSADGITTYSDEPCAQDAKVFIRETPAGVDGAVSKRIDMRRGRWSETQDEDNIAADAKRIAAAILPNMFFTSSDVINIRYSPTDTPPDFFERATPHNQYDRVPGWKVNLKYNSAKRDTEYDISFRFDNKRIKDISGKVKSEVLLRTISIQKDGKPFNPDTMENLQHLKLIKTGHWEYQR